MSFPTFESFAMIEEGIAVDDQTAAEPVESLNGIL